jgi:hypothetical protein
MNWVKIEDLADLELLLEGNKNDSSVHQYIKHG